MKSIDKTTLPRFFFFFSTLQENGIYILDPPNSHKEGSRMMGLECCLALGSSCLRKPGHSFLWRQTKKSQGHGCCGSEKRKRQELGMFSRQLLISLLPKALPSPLSLSVFHFWFPFVSDSGSQSTMTHLGLRNFPVVLHLHLFICR